MSLNAKLKTTLNDVSKEDTIYDNLILMGDAGDFSSGKYNSMTNYVVKKKSTIVHVGYTELLKIFK